MPPDTPTALLPGRRDTGTSTARGSDYAALSRQVKQAGLLGRRPGYYTAKIATNLVLVGAGWVGFVLLGDSWWQLAVAVFLGVMFTQCGFLAHDAGHKQIARTRRASYLLGLLHGNLAIGLSYGWWIDKHNRHHAHPNDVDRDPDVGPGAVVFTASQARIRRGLGRWVCRWQAYLFFPMLLLEGLNLHLASLRAVRRRTGRSRWVEGSLLAGHVGGYLTALLLVLSPNRALAFLVVQQAVFGLTMGCSFAPNHKGMPLLRATDKVDYLRRQVLTSRNVRGGRVVDFALGGLNYQIEHHLFPSMPRANLKAAQPLVQAFCNSHDIVYRNSSLLDSYTQALRHLHAVGAPLRTTPGHPGDTLVEAVQPEPVKDYPTSVSWPAGIAPLQQHDSAG